MDPKADEDAEALAAILSWHLDMGVDWVVDETPHDRFADHAAELAKAAARAAPNRPPATRPAASNPPASSPPASSPPASSPPASSPPASSPPASVRVVDMADRGLSTEAAARSAAEIAASAVDLDALRAVYEAFDGCALKRGATRLVFADGAPNARLMLIGEAPGAEEDRTGLPFVGRAGHLLDRMLAAIHLDRTSVYIANVAPWRPPGNRTPTPQEVAICMPFLQRQIALVAPDIVLALGGAAAQALFSLKDGIMRTRGVWRSYDLETPMGRRTLAGMATLHPAYLLRSPGAKRLAWRDLREIRKALDKLPPRMDVTPDP